MYLRERQKLNQEIHKENEIRKIVNLVVPQVRDQLKPFIGEKIIKADEYLVKKFTDKVEFLKALRDKIKVKPMEGFEHAKLHCLYVTATRYSIRIEVSASFTDSDHTCCYAKGMYYVGDIKNSLISDVDNGTLQKVNDWVALDMLSAAQEWKKYERAAKAKAAAEKAADAMWYGLREWVR